MERLEWNCQNSSAKNGDDLHYTHIPTRPYHVVMLFTRRVSLMAAVLRMKSLLGIDGSHMETLLQDIRFGLRESIR
jgi:hypothetical protein